MFSIRVIWWPILLGLLLLLSACGGGESSQLVTEELEIAELLTIEGQEGPLEVALPAAMAERTNVVFVYRGAVDEQSGWMASQEEGRRFLEASGDNMYTATVERVPPGEGAEAVLRALADEGFEVIFATDFEYMGATARVAAEFPETAFVHLGGHKKAEPNFGNVYGAMEEMSYLGGMVAGAKASKNGAQRIGIIASSPSVEAIRLSNATVRGMKKSCPSCVADIRWLFSSVLFERKGENKQWEDEIAAAVSLMDEGAGVIVAHTGSRKLVEAVAQQGLNVIVGGVPAFCEGYEEYCLGVMYWNWGAVYLELVNQVVAGSWVPENFYGSRADGMLGLYGFMEGQMPYPNVPERIVPEIKALLSQMQAGTFTRFDIFRGPLKDIKGETVLAVGKRLTQADLEGFTTAYLITYGITERELCTRCLDFLVEGFVSEAAIPKANSSSAQRVDEAKGDRDEKKQVVRFMSTDDQPERVAVYEAVAREYMKGHPNVEIVIEPVKEPKLMAQLLGGDELPDIVRLGVEQVPVLAADGLLDQAASEAVIASIGSHQFQKGLLEMVTDPATRFYAAVPFDGWVQAIWYRRDLFDALGLPPPTTWETIARANRMLATTGELRYGITLGTDPEQNYGHQLFEQVAISAGAYPFDGEGEVTMNTPEMIQALRWMADLQAYALPGAQYWRGAREAYEQDQTGMLFYSTYIMDDLVDGSSLEDGGQVEIAVQDLAKKSGFAAQMVGPKGSVTYGQLVTLGILRHADPAAQDVVEFFLTEGYGEIIALVPFGKIPVLRGAVAEWKASSDYFEFYADDTLDKIATGYKTMQRWVLRPDYTLTQRAVIGDIESHLLIPQVLHNLTVQNTMTPEQAAEFLQEEVEGLLNQRLGE